MALEAFNSLGLPLWSSGRGSRRIPQEHRPPEHHRPVRAVRMSRLHRHTAACQDVPSSRRGGLRHHARRSAGGRAAGIAFPARRDDRYREEGVTGIFFDDRPRRRWRMPYGATGPGFRPACHPRARADVRTKVFQQAIAASWSRSTASTSKLCRDARIAGLRGQPARGAK